MLNKTTLNFNEIVHFRRLRKQLLEANHLVDFART